MWISKDFRKFEAFSGVQDLSADVDGGGRRSEMERPVMENKRRENEKKITQRGDRGSRPCVAQIHVLFFFFFSCISPCIHIPSVHSRGLHLPI